MNLYDLFAFIGLFVGIAAIRFVCGLIIGMVNGSATGEESFYAWIVDLFVTSFLVAVAIVYMIKTGRISIV